MKTRIDYETLAKKVGSMVLCNRIHETSEDWFEHILQGNTQPADWDEAKDGEWEMPQVYQSYIITPHGASELINHTDEIVWYNTELEVFIWDITHYGTAWNGVTTDYDPDAEHVYDLSYMIKHF